ncbi:hypothetical protein E1I69_11150 [Bacillus timonensis]|uniref:WXG100 family type VII secretion target n=1 Tax=Bacillus timonensis TaxID=1033734 RepID=A0A4S3PSL0_9BACI|nr:hypothetical protein [Bacillus timonensis]THE12414.1 hypothetical protein E1I69_11150 [Bacillus timonensis]
MSVIKIKTNYVLDTNQHLTSASTRLWSIKMDLSSVRYSIDSRITSRQNIAGRLSEAYQKASEVQNKIKQVETFIQQAAQRYNSTENKVCNQAKDIVENNGWKYDLARNATIGAGAALLNSNKLLRVGKGLQFHMYKKNGKTFIKLMGDKIKNLRDFEKYYGLLKEGLGGTAKWTRDYVTNLVNKGIPLYQVGNPGKYYSKNASKLINSNFEAFDDAINRIDDPFHKIAGRTFVDEMKVWESFTGWKDATNVTKFGKGLGVLGIGIDVYSNFNDNLMENGKFNPTAENIKEFTVDTTVDIGAGAAAMAAGAAAGSFFLPPAGTIVGAVAGTVAYGAINWKVFGDKSIVDLAKDGANAVVDKAVEWGGEAVDFIGDTAKDIGKGVGEAAEKVGDFVGGIGKALDEVFW